jgi:C-8 sterol isomerase
MGYIFDPQHLHAVAKRTVGLPHAEMVRLLVQDLARAYPGHIESSEEWIWSLFGGATGLMTILHGSLSEYLLIFGSPIGTEGFSGRYRLDIYDFMLVGEMWTYTEDRFRERIVIRPGEIAHLGRRQAKGFKLPEGGWMLEYGRGPVVTALPFALSHAIVSMELRTIWKTIRGYGRLVARELRRGKI